MGADYTKTPPELHVLSTDSTGALIVDVSGSTGNSAAGPTGAPVPADADYIGFNLAGNLVGVSAANPLPVSVTAIVSDTVNQGTQGTIASSWYVEITNGTTVLGTPTNPIRIDPTGTTVQPVSISGTVPVSGPVSTTTTAAPASTSVTSTSSSLLSANSLRLEFSVVNTGTVAVYLAFNTRTPTATAYSIALSPCTTANDGTGGTFTSDLIKGSVSAITASTSGTVCVTEYVA